MTEHTVKAFDEDITRLRGLIAEMGGLAELAIQESMSALVVLTNVPDQTVAERLARDLVARRLAACVNLLAPCRSIYRWEGEVQQDEEVPLLIKTTRARYPALEAAIREGHPAELPEIVAVPVECGLAAYLDWVSTETTP